MPTSLPSTPAYAQRFRCLGSSCPDTCCQNWNVPVDQAAYERLRQLPPSSLHALIDESILIQPQATSPATFATIRLDASNRCPLLTAEGLCRIHAELGDALLPEVCSSYPRIHQSIGGISETALALSCPEAARVVLLTPDLCPLHKANSAFQTSAPAQLGDSTEDGPLTREWSGTIRAIVFEMVLARSYPLWQRLFLLGIFCRRLDSLAAGELKQTVPGFLAGFLAGFQASFASGALRPAMEALPADGTLQLDAVLRLAGLMLRRSQVTPRFAGCVQAFTAGIGNTPGATLVSLAANYAQAHHRYLEPFLRSHPYILENFLVNAVVRLRFPFGRSHRKISLPLSRTREFTQLSAQFALMKGLLTGVAGFHREAFSGEHVVHTLQSASKHFEHHPKFLNEAFQLLAESGMDGARGWAILLRNPGRTNAAEPMPASPGLDVPAPPPGRIAPFQGPLPQDQA